MSLFFINLDVESPERYDLAKFLEYSDNFDPLTSSFLKSLKDLKYEGTYIVQGEEYRPELLAHRIYGNVQYWWILMAYNAINSHEDLTTGLVLKYPNLEDLENLYFSLKSQEATK